MKSALKSFVGVLSGLLLAGATLAQSFPSKPVTLMVPYPAGDVSDVIARTLNTTLAKHLGQPVIGENRSEERRVGKECRSRGGPYQ